MPTLTSEKVGRVGATGVRFAGNTLYVSLDDGREIGVLLDRISWLDWLAKANDKQRANWAIEPGGFAIYWNELDDGIEVDHLLKMQPVI